MLGIDNILPIALITVAVYLTIKVTSSLFKFALFIGIVVLVIKLLLNTGVINV